MTNTLKQDTTLLSVINAVDEALALSDEPQQILDLALDTLLKVLPIDCCWIQLLDEKNDKLTLAAQRGFTPKMMKEMASIKLEQGINTHAVQPGKPIAVSELPADVRYSWVLPGKVGSHSFAAVPLSSPGRIQGVMGVASSAAGQFTTEMVALLATIASQISIALDKANLYQQARKKERQLRESEARILEQRQISDAISRLTKTITYKESVGEAFEPFAKQLRELMDFNYLSISLIEGNTVRATAISPTVATELSTAATYPLKDSVTGWVARHKTTLIEPELTEEHLPPHDNTRLSKGLKSSIHVPLSSKGEVSGCLNLYSSRPGTYGERERMILEQLAVQIAGVVQYLILYSQERAHRIELERQAAERLDFTRAVSHELKTPLTSIIAAAEMLSEELQKKAPGYQQRLVQNIVHSAHSLETNIEELLNTTKKKTLQLQLLSLNIGGLLEQVSEHFQPVAERKQQHLVADLPDSLPLISGDPQRLAQVVRNLLMNASKFTPTGGSITLRAKKQNANLVIAVEDNGIGIPEDEQGKLFEPYYRVEADRRRFSGVGLGLALSKQIVELHGGTIWVESEPGKGSTFAFSLPL